MSDIELINKAAGRIYPTHLNEDQDPNFSSWESVLPSSLKSGFKGSVGHVQKSLRNSHTLTHKFDDGHSLEVNLTTGKNHIAVVKMGKGARTFTAIHSNEDPQKAIQIAYDAVRSRSLKEETEITLIEKMEKRIEKKTGKLSGKKEKIDVEPSEEKELKESTPPGMESWVKKNKAHFVKEYGEKKGHEVLYATAWKLHNKMNEMEELNELSKKTLASYVKHATHHARNVEFDAGRHYKEDKKRSDKEVAISRKRQAGIGKAADKLAEAHTYTKEGLAKQIKYHENRASHHDSEAQASFNKAQDLIGDKADLHFNAAKGHKAIADLHRKHIYDLKSFAGLTEAEGKVEMMYLSKGFISPKLAEKLARESKHLGTDKSTGEQHYLHPQHGRMALVPHKPSGQFQFRLAEEIEQLDELSPHTLGMYTKIASIDMAHHRAQGAISHRAQIDAESRGSKESAKTHEDNKIQQDKKATKRLNGIIKATDKLVHKAVAKEEQLEETRVAPHPDKVVMTSSIRKDLGGGYMAKTRNGHFYKLIGEPGKGRELPKIGAILDTSKHKFIGKDKVDLGMLKESTENNYLGQLVGKYLTHSGKTGIEIRRHAIGTYSYSGEWGAGGGHSKTEMDKTANRLLRLHPRHKIEKKYYGDLHNIKEDLDHNHPDMKEYHAAVKASDEAHLKSIRYRMNHDIKQPEHRAKYDELEAEHHRLRDIEDQAPEKVHGRLFAHHAGFKE